MYDQIREDTLFIMLYAVVTATAMLASCYLLFRRANAIAPDITPPVRLRRWTAVFFAQATTVACCCDDGTDRCSRGMVRSHP